MINLDHYPGQKKNIRVVRLICKQTCYKSSRGLFSKESDAIPYWSTSWKKGKMYHTVIDLDDLSISSVIGKGAATYICRISYRKFKEYFLLI